MLKLFKKPHVISVHHIQYSSLRKSYSFYDIEHMIPLIQKILNIKNYGYTIYFNKKSTTQEDLLKIYNANTKNEKKESELKLSFDFDSFVKELDIENYTPEFYISYPEWKDTEGHYVFTFEGESRTDYEFFSNLELKENLKNLIKAKIEHSYMINPNKMNRDEYIEILQMYGPFYNNDELENCSEINQWINDARELEELDVIYEKKPKKEED